MKRVDRTTGAIGCVAAFIGLLNILFYLLLLIGLAIGVYWLWGVVMS